LRIDIFSLVVTNFIVETHFEFCYSRCLVFTDGMAEIYYSKVYDWVDLHFEVC